MKRLGNLFEQTANIENLKRAHEKAKKKKNSKQMKKEIKKVDDNLEESLRQIRELLLNKEYKTSTYRFYTIRDKGKEREIAILPYFPDRIIHWAIILVLKDMFKNSFIHQTYAAIPQKGTHKAMYDVQKHLRRNATQDYCLKIDIVKFFPNIDKQKLKTLLRRKIKDSDLLWLLDEVIDSYPKKGIPIGNLTSQWFGNFYLNHFDYWVKQEMKIKGYFRYMDDCIFIGSSKKDLWNLFNEIQKYLNDQFGLQLKDNYQIYKISDSGVNFVGYRIYRSKIILRNHAKRNMIRKMNKLKKKNRLSKRDQSIVGSYNGAIKHVTGIKLKEDILIPVQERVKSE